MFESRFSDAESSMRFLLDHIDEFYNALSEDETSGVSLCPGPFPAFRSNSKSIQIVSMYHIQQQQQTFCERKHNL